MSENLVEPVERRTGPAAGRPASRPRIVLLHQPDDPGGQAGYLHSVLRHNYPAGEVFADFGRSSPGTDTGRLLEEVVAGCAVLLVVVGPGWLDALGPSTDGPLGRALRTALRANGRIRVIPILVKEATLPEPHDLPAELTAFARLRPFHLTNHTWAHDIETLTAEIDAVFPPDSLPPRPKTGSATLLPPLRRRRAFYAPGLALDSVAAALTTAYRRDGLDVQLLHFPDGLVLQARQHSAWRKAIGMAAAFNVVLRRHDRDLVIEVGWGRWIAKAAVSGLGLLGVWPLLATTAYGSWRQVRLTKHAFEIVQELVHQHQRTGG